MIHNESQTVQQKEKTEKKIISTVSELWCTLLQTVLNKSWCVVFFLPFILNTVFEFLIANNFSLTEKHSVSHSLTTWSCPYIVCDNLRFSPQGWGKAKTLAQWKHFTIINNSQVVSIMYIVHYRNTPMLIIVYHENANKWKLMYRDCQSRNPLCMSFSSLIFLLGHPQHLAIYYLKKNKTSHD